MDAVRKEVAERADSIRQHLHDYIETDGAVGYLRDQSPRGGSAVALHLVLRTIGRKSGDAKLAPLMYAAWGDEFVVVGSRGGHEHHPAWYLNLISRREVEFQVRDKRYRGTWRVAEGDERATLWDYLTVYHSGYSAYQARTTRELPVVVLTATERIVDSWTVPPDAMATVGRE